MLLFNILDIMWFRFLYILCVGFSVYISVGALVAPCLQCRMDASFVPHFDSGRCALVVSSLPSPI